MKLKTLLTAFVISASNVLFAQTEDFYTVPFPDNKNSHYLIYKPDSGFYSLLQHNPYIQQSLIQPAITNYGERTVLFNADTFTIETDRSLAIYFKTKKGKRDIFLKHNLSENKCWQVGSVAIVNVSEKDKNILSLQITSTIGAEKQPCSNETLQINIEENYANTTGIKPASFVQNVANGISLTQEKKALLILLPRQYLNQLVSVNFYLLTKKGEVVKEFINMKAAENILYIGDLPKGKYQYKVETYEGMLLKKGEISLTKIK